MVCRRWSLAWGITAWLVTMVVTVGCGGRPAPGSGAQPAAPRGVFGEVAFPRHADFEYDPGLGIARSREHVVVAFRATATEADATRAIADSGGTLVGALGSARITLVRLPAGLSADEQRARVKSLAKHPAVSAAAFDFPLSVDVQPADTADRERTGWSWPHGRPLWHLRAMGMPLAWNLNELIAQERTERTVKVAVLDATFQAHRDLVPDIMTVADDDFDEPDAAEQWRSHGTAVAGLIGARWDGQYMEGVSPFVRIFAAPVANHDRSSAIADASGWADIMEEAWTAVQRHRPRLVSISMGMNSSKTCYGPANAKHRCDPRQGTTQWGTPVPDSRCDGDDVLDAIAAGGAAFDQLVHEAQRGGPVMFVVAAGNDSGPMTTSADYCSNQNSTLRGMGEFPAALNSPMAWAGTELANPNILVVEVVKPIIDMRGAIERAEYSNVNGHILAPGHEVASLRGGRESSQMRDFRGTSAATPIVSGALAYLVALAPGITNPDLRRAVLAQDGRAVAGTQTTKRLYVPTAIEHMQIKLPGGLSAPGDRVLADIDDGTSDGLTRVLYNAWGDETPYTGRRTYGAAPRTTIADVRYLRDSIAFAAGVGEDCPASVYACDLNGNGSASRGTEPNMRANLGHETIDLAKLARYYERDPLQGYAEDAIPALMSSADIIIDPGPVMRKAGVTSISITLAGSYVAGKPRLPAHAPLTDIVITTDQQRILTTPLILDMSISVTIPAPVNRTFTRRLGDLHVGQNRFVPFNPCALDPGSTADFFAPTRGQCDAPTPPPVTVSTAPTPSNCAELQASRDPYFCFTLRHASFTRTLAWKVDLTSTATNRTYYYGLRGKTFIRLSGQGTFDGTKENVRIDTLTEGDGPAATNWPTDFPLPFSMSFFNVATGRSTMSFEQPDGRSTGRTVITNYPAVGGLVEGTFSGELRGTRSGGEAIEEVQVSGSFRVKRTADQ